MYPLKPYNDFKPTSNWNTFYYFKNVFDDQMIAQLDKMVYSNYTFSKGRTGVKHGRKPGGTNITIGKKQREKIEQQLIHELNNG